MRLLFASDIHGDTVGAQNVIDAFYKEKCEKIVLCGDILYHGPRNDLPPHYNPKEVIKIMNSESDKIIAVRGNCDSEVDQMVLDFPLMCDYTLICDDNIRIYVTHGHIYNNDNLLKLKENDVFVNGHTHVLAAEKRDTYFYLNPGSASIPKENNPPTYMVYEDGVFTIKTFDAKMIKEINVNTK